ncbi:bacilysin biosynthesis protein BacA [Streptomyces gobiensis]|uniref:bacilysin biosynthesis protein BacA n=1 Tax=Streptomyces gobiensis TaxID=2875706 RepID=UPI001E580796|nr:bacilysin biosynthesis protein BacA [Streptomyces gobiensis]UGY94581.1 bacilysin biosynthesis protein BacA [Streptomyces gobiensis]
MNLDSRHTTTVMCAVTIFAEIPAEKTLNSSLTLAIDPGETRPPGGDMSVDVVPEECSEYPLVGGIRYLHTLGPPGTNLEAASHLWLRRRGLADEGADEERVFLHPSLESAMETVPRTGEHALVACAVYPRLHTLVFSNLRTCRMVDSFVAPTHAMVLAATPAAPSALRTVASHPAPVGLVPPESEPRMALSNSQAAIDCASGKADGCITTVVAAQAHGLRVMENFGPIPMVYTVHHLLAATR